MGTIKVKRGEKSRLPQSASLGELLYCTDTNELYVGQGDTKQVSKVFSDDFKFLQHSIKNIGASSSKSVPITSKLGIHWYTYFNTINVGNGVDTTTIPLMKNIGFKYTRVLMEWKNIETKLGQYDFSNYDKYIDICISEGLTPIVYLGEHPNDSLGLTYEDTILRYLDFVNACTLRYCNKNIVWEIYNEPNIGFWFSKTERTVKQYYDYADMAIKSAKIIRANDPTGFIVAGVLADFNDYYTEKDFSVDNYRFTDCLGKRGLYDYIDAFSHHPYSLNRAPEKFLSDKHNLIKNCISKYTDRDIPIVVTEFGYTTATRTPSNGSFPITITEKQQADYLVRACLLLDSLNCPIISLFQWINTSSQLDDIESNFGIVFNDGTTMRQSALSLKTMISNLDGYYFTGRVVSPSNIYILKYSNGLHTKLVAWSTDGDIKYKVSNTVMTLTETPCYVDCEDNVLTGNNEVTSLDSSIMEILNSEQSPNDITNNGLTYCTSSKDIPIPNMIVLTTGVNNEWNNNYQLGMDNWTGDLYSRAKRFVDGSEIWTKWSKSVRSDDVTSSIVAVPLENESTGFIKVNRIDLLGKSIVNIQGNVSGIQSSDMVVIGHVPTECKPSNWISGVVRTHPIKSSPVYYEIGNVEGEIRLLTSPGVEIVPSDKVVINISYVVTD